MTTTEEEFIKAITSFEPIVVKEEYRAYYDNDNKIMYLMANQFPDDNNNWIPITKVQYQTLECQWLWLEKDQLVERKPVYNHYFSLTPSTKGVKIVKNHAGIVVEQDEEYPDVGYYDKIN
jgi:hypothetical protein